tara:strand:- start:251 stop:523 length:273 start_codon:yes stop_codon:yes gene_type:complete
MSETTPEPKPLKTVQQYLIKFGLALNLFMPAMLLLAHFNEAEMRGEFFDGNPFFIIGYIACCVYLVVLFLARWQSPYPRKGQPVMTLEIY